ncbi:SDR family NAD(P)-dependent oxidoreductase [Stakelama saccharophila]|uniref:SDR family NAD(P)-dependent oxidoreductase n=1 Tax=Stakelama saccharophila TaxID=3075605 RepID=A0ABZ0B6W8_9SPHN|nr:SDR family NAD(P)-dependent oxidoreductase [Stakelama sp. W311]WNO52861.1 SDR family NAD(P)-dependent oxidoreductase [Stakelama sp. W311]
MSNRQQTILITGGAGFIGSNLADRLAREGCRVIVFDKLARKGVEDNLRWLQQRHGQAIVPVVADLSDRDTLWDAVSQADAAFHFAAQVAVTTSMIDPREDFRVNAQGTLELLEALRAQPREIPLVFASTNKVYGDLGDIGMALGQHGHGPTDPDLAANGVSEARPLDFHTPYGCSKGAADQYVLDYARSFGLPAAVLRMSCIYGHRQMGTEDQGWVAHFAIRALEDEPITLYGDGEQVRDLLDVDDAVAAYLAAWRNIDAVRGNAFNLGGGPRNAVRLRDVILHLEAMLGRSVTVRHADWRPGDQRWFVADTRAIDSALDLPEKTAWRDGVASLLRWLSDYRSAGTSRGGVGAPQRQAAAS